MTHTMDQIGHDPAFERFLRATVGDDVNGKNVSVISMFARLEVDPWTEASDLAAMSDGPARKRLETLMTRFKDVPTQGRDRGKTISTLLDLPPKKKVVENPNSLNELASLPALVMRVPLHWYIIAFIILGWFIHLAQGQ